MATKERIEPVDLGYGQVGHTFWKSYALGNIPGRDFHVTPRLAKPYQEYYINGGCKTVSINVGAPTSTHGPIARANKSTFLNNVTDGVHGGDWAAYSVDDAKQAAQNVWNAHGGYGFITSGAEEPRYDGDPGATIWSTNPTAYFEFNKELTRICELNGAVNAGSYDGVFYPNFEGNIGAFRTALSSNQAAFQYLQANQHPRHPFFTQNMWESEHPTLNQYFRSSINLVNRHINSVGSSILVRMALRHVAATINPIANSRRICHFYFDGKTEFVNDNAEGYSQRYTLKDGDTTVEEYDFPDYSPEYQLNTGFYGTEFCEDVFGWEDWRMYGEVRGRYEDPFQRSDGFWMRRQLDQNGNMGNYLPTSSAKNPYDPSHNYPFGTSAFGSKDLAAAGRKIYEQALAFLGGSGEGTWARHSTTTGAYCSEGSSYLADRMEDRLMVVRRYRNGNKVVVKADDFESPFNVPVERRIDLGNGQSDVFLVWPNVINCWKVTL
ncbi:hypothetical protein [Spirosoma utsteinense]|uniref:hypothetical protein n=1 Tax=Spirosoma utsteinense TaxID=2585773 RepID=UPI0016488BB5|nr:hypothetical protein [Spirosoma utsteinense]MBC3785721.1 hypothetical protein [Spirosoma utsteinense]